VTIRSYNVKPWSEGLSGPDSFKVPDHVFGHRIESKPMSALQTQVAGNHYSKMKIQPMEFSMANKLDACQHTVIKYVCRYRDKNGIEDLKKAKHVIDMLIEFEEMEK
jgi:hypothetical protein